jgi:hypothetical protein
MRFYTQQHRHYWGLDLHARSLYLSQPQRYVEAALGVP